PESGDDVLGGQGQLGIAALAGQGLLSSPAADSDAARGYDLEIPRDDRVPEPPRAGNGGRVADLDQSGWSRTGHRTRDPRRHRAYRRDEDPGAEAGARQMAVRRRHRRRAPRRGEVAGQGAHLLVPQRAASLGPEEPA